MGKLLYLMVILCSNLTLAKSYHKYKIKKKHYHKVSLQYFSDPNSIFNHSTLTVDGRVMNCFCGEESVALFMMYGHIQGFCGQHINLIQINHDNGETHG